MKVVWVEWLDATFMGNTWKRIDKLGSEPSGFQVESAGFLVHEDEQGLYLAVDSDPADRNKARGVSFIPHHMIKRRKVFQVMPYKSKAQQRAMHAKAERGEIPQSVVKEFDRATKKRKGGFKALPEKKKARKK